MGRETAGRRGPARKLDRAAQLHVTLPESLDSPQRLQDASLRSRRGRRIDQNPPHPARFCALARKNRR